MSSTTTFGIDIDTGNSVTNLDRTTKSMDSLLEKYVALMGQAGKSEKAFSNISKAIGLHTKIISEASRDANKILVTMTQSNMGKAKDMTVRGLSRNITSQFKGLTTELKTALQAIPSEISSVITQLNAATNSAISGKLDVTDVSQQFKEAFKEVPYEIRKASAHMGGMLELINNQVGGIRSGIDDLKVSLQNLGRVAQEEKKKLEGLTGGNKPKDVELSRKEKFNQAANVRLRDEQETIVSIHKVKTAAGELQKTLVKLRESPISVTDKDYEAYAQSLHNVKTETNELQVANRDMSGDATRAMMELSLTVKNTSAEYGLLKKAAEATKRATSTAMAEKIIGVPRIREEEAKATIDRVAVHLHKLKDAIAVDTLADEEITQIAQALGDAQKKIQDITNSNKVYGKVATQELSGVLVLYKQMENALKKIQKEQSVTQNKKIADDSGEAQLQKIKERKEALDSTLKEGFGKWIDTDDKQDLVFVTNALTKTQFLLSEIHKKDADTISIFQDIEEVKRYTDELKGAETTLRGMAREYKNLDIAMSNKLVEQADKIKEQSQTFKLIMKGIDPTNISTKAFENTSIIQSKQELELLEKIQEATDRTLAARKKLNESKGSLVDVGNAKKELTEITATFQGLRKEQKAFKDIMSALGLSGTTAVDNINEAVHELKKSMTSLGSSANASEKSFRNMWGAMTMGLGKFLLAYHTLSIVIGGIQNAANMIKSTLSGVMSIAEPVTNLEKALRLMNETKGGMSKARKEMEFFKDTANELGFAYTDLADGFKQFKEIAEQGGSTEAYSGIMDIWKKMAAAARATGQQGELSDFFKGFTDAIGKGQIMTEELKKQLAQRLPGLIKGIEKEVADFRGIDPEKFNIFDAIEKGKVKLSEFMAAFQNYLPKWSAMGESMGDSYSAAVGRLKNAWTDLVVKISTSKVGLNIINAIEKMTADLKDDSILAVIETVVKSFLTISKTLLRLAEYTIPQIGRAIRQIPIIGSDENIAKGSSINVQNAAAQAVKQSPMWDLVYNSQQMGGVVSGLFMGEQNSIALDKLGLRDLDPVAAKLEKQISNRLIASFESEDWGSLFAEGWIFAAKDGTIKVAQTASEAARNKVEESVLQTEKGLADKVFIPMLHYLQEMDGDFAKVEKKIRQAQGARSSMTGAVPLLSIETVAEKPQAPKNLNEIPSMDLFGEVPKDFWEENADTAEKIINLPNAYLKDYLILTQKKFMESSVDLGNRSVEPMTTLLRSIFIDIDGGILEHLRSTYADLIPTTQGFGLGILSALPTSAVPSTYAEYDRAASAEQAAKEREKLNDILDAQKEKLMSYQNLLDAAGEDGNWARKIVKEQSKTQLDIVKDRNDFKDKMESIKDVSDPDEQKKIDELRAQVTAVHEQSMETAAAAGSRKKLQFYNQAMQELDSIDAEIQSRIAGGNLKNELKTQYEDLIKWQVNTTKKLQQNYAGLEGVDLEQRYADIQKAVERGSEQALTQGNTPMEIIAKAEKRAAQGRIDAWESTYKELVQQTDKYSQIQIQHQWDLMATLDDISGLRTAKEKQRIEEAAAAVAEQFNNIALLKPITDLKLTEQDQADFGTRKGLIGDIYDADKIEETTLASQKLTAQMRILQEEGKDTAASYKELARQQQALTDQVKEAEIANAGSFEEYLNKRFAHEHGLSDNDVSATKKRYEDMYAVLDSGATEIGGTIKETFIDAFSGTLDSWNDVWKSMKQTFIRTLAEMVWESKMRPITVGIIAGVTGMGTGSAFAKDSEGGALADQVASLLGGGTKGSADGKGGLFSSFAKLPDAIDSFGKDVLQLGNSISLAKSLGAGLMGFGLGSAIGGSTAAGVGGAMGSAVGNMAGQALADTFGAMAPGIGQVIGMAAGTVIGSMFAGDKVTSKGMELSIGSDGLLYAKKYTNYKSSGMFGGGKRTEYDAADRAVVSQLNKEISRQTTTLEQAFKNLGMVTSSEGFTAKGEKIDLRENPEEAIKAWITKVTGQMADYMVGGSGEYMKFELLKDYSETSADAVVRLATALSNFTDTAIEANMSIDNLTGGMKGLDLAYYASKLTDALGGEEQLQDFFDIITDFSTYMSGAGAENISALTDELATSFQTIKDVYQTQGSNAQISNKRTQITDSIANRESLYYNNIAKYDLAGTAWGSFINMNPQTELIELAEGFNEWIAGSSKRTDLWNNSLKGWIESYNNYVKSIPKLQEELAGLMTDEANNPTAQIDPSSTTFWTDFDKVLKNMKGLTPELAAAWYEAAKLAQQISETREATYEAAEAQRELKATYWESNLVTVKAAMYMGISSEGLLNLAREAQALNSNDLPAWFEANAASIENLVPGLSALTYEGETALEAFNRLGQTLMDITDAAGVAGVSLSDMSGGLVGLDLAAFAQDLVGAFGSSDAVSAAFQRYNKLVNSEDAQKTLGQDYWAKEATARFGVLQDKFPGVTTSNFADEYKAAMAQGLSPTELKQWDYAAEAMENMTDAAGAAADAIDELTKYLASIQEKIDKLGMSDVDSFLYDLQKESEEMKQEIIDKGGSSAADVLSGKVTVADTAKVDEYYAAAIANKLKGIMDDVVSGMDDINLSSYDKQMKEIKETTAENIDAVTKLGGTEADLAKVREYETLQINKLKEAHQEYLDEIQDKIDAFGQSDTDKFLNDLDKEVQEMKKKIVDVGGAAADTSIADAYRTAAIQNQLKSTMDGITDSIMSLKTDAFVYKLQQVNKTMVESIKGIQQLGGSEEDLIQARYLASLQAQEIIEEAAQAYITAYDDKLQEIEDLKNEKQALMDAVDTARNEYMDALQKEIDLKQESIDKLQESVDSLEAFVDSMEDLKSSLLSDAGFLSATEKAGASLNSFLSIAKKAAEGDEDARSALSGAASSAVEAAKGGSYENYLRTFATVYGKVSSVQDSAKADLAKQKPELEALIASRDSLQAIYDKLSAEADTSKTINEALTAYEEAKKALLTSTLDAQIATAQAEADRHKETVEFLKKQYEETANLNGAAQAYFSAVQEAQNLGLVDESVVQAAVDKSSILSATAVATDATQKALQTANTTADQSKKVLEKTYNKTDEILYFMQEDNKKMYYLFSKLYKGEHSTTVDGVTTTDVGLKAIVLNATTKSDIIAALREANDLGTVPATSIVGLLNAIKNCSCTQTTCTYYEEEDVDCGIMSVDDGAEGISNAVATSTDSSELATHTAPKIFSTLDGAMTVVMFNGDFNMNIRQIDGTLGTEAPECSSAFYFIINEGADV